MKATNNLVLFAALLMTGIFAFYLKTIFSKTHEYRAQAGDLIEESWLKSLGTEPSTKLKGSFSDGQPFVIEIANKPEIWSFLPKGEKLEVQITEARLIFESTGKPGDLAQLQEAWVGAHIELKKRLSEALHLEAHVGKILLPTPQLITQ